MIKFLKFEFFYEWSWGWIWTLFIVLSIFVFITSIIIPRLLINLLKKTNISHIIIGILILSIITSIPEIISVYSFASSGNSEELNRATTNIWGANFLSITFVCIFDFIYFKDFVFKKTSKILKKTSLFVVLFNFLFLLILIFPSFFKVFKIKNFSFITIFLILFYMGFIFYLEINSRIERKKFDVEKEDVGYFKFRRTSTILFLLNLIFIFILIFSVIIIVSISNKIKTKYEWTESTIGGLLFASLTSSPEIWSALSFFQLGLGVAGIGTILGSHLFNVVAFVSVDFISDKQFVGPFVESAEGILMAFVFINSLLLFVNIIRPISNKKRDYLFFPFLIISFFVLTWSNILS